MNTTTAKTRLFPKALLIWLAIFIVQMGLAAAGGGAMTPAYIGQGIGFSLGTWLMGGATYWLINRFGEGVKRPLLTWSLASVAWFAAQMFGAI